MTTTEDNVKIQRITRLLEKGGTMLAMHHDCGSPMFRYQGKTICPVCDYEEKQDKEPELRKEQIEKKREQLSIGKSPVEDYEKIAALIRNRIKHIAASLENETDLLRLKDRLECIEIGIRILRSLE
jgi:UPF0148 protein